MTPFGQELFNIAATALRPVACNECGKPALRHEFGRDWCLECVGQVEKEMNALCDQATAQEKAVAEEIDRLKRLQKREWRGTPHEL